jgi:proline iminopeptidase
MRAIVAVVGLLTTGVSCARPSVDPGPARFPTEAAVPVGLRAGVHEVAIQGVRQWYRVAGEGEPGGPPVVFLHGGPGQGSVHFAALAGPALEPHARMVYYDQRGSGLSQKPADPSAYSLPILVEDVEGLRRELGVPEIVLVGHSFGGTLALEYAAKYPRHVAGLVIVDGLWSIPLQCGLRLRTLATLRPAAYARVAGDTLAADGTQRDGCSVESRAFASGEERSAYDLEALYPDPAVRARIDSVNAEHGTVNTGEMGRGLFGSGALEAYHFAAFERLTMPVLVIGGRYDGAARPEGLRALAERLPDARFLEYERSGHFPYLDETDRFASDLARFLDQVRGGGR